MATQRITTKSKKDIYVRVSEMVKSILEREKAALGANSESATIEKLYAELLQYRAEKEMQNNRKSTSKLDRFAEIRKAFDNLKAANEKIWATDAVKQVPNLSYFSNREKNGVGVFSRGLVHDYLQTAEVTEYIELLEKTFETWQLTSNFKRHS